MEQEIVHRSTPASSVFFQDAPICVTAAEGEERSKIENQTVAQITKVVEELLSQIVNAEARDLFEVAWQSEVLHRQGKKATKPDFIQFYYEVKEFLEDETGYMEGLGEVDDGNE